MKKIIALILTLIMALTVMPTALLAEGGEIVPGISGNLNLNSGDHSNKQLDIDGYTWNDTERVLTVKNLKIDGSLWLPNGDCEIVINGVLDVGDDIRYTGADRGDLKITGGTLIVNDSIVTSDNLTLNNVSFTGGILNNHTGGENENTALILTNSTVNADSLEWDTGNGVILQNSTINYNSSFSKIFYASKIGMDINSVITTTNNICSRTGGLDQIIKYLPEGYKIGETQNMWGNVDTILDKGNNLATNLTIKHYHTYDQETATETYKKSDATCTLPAAYFKSCICGLASTTETFTNGTAAGHKWGAWQQTKAPTVDAEGEQKRICNKCRLAETMAIPKLDAEKPVEVTGGTTISDPERDFWYKVRKEVEASDKGDIVTVNAKEYTSMPWYVMDALRDNGVGMKIYWDGETIKIPAGKALNEKRRTYYPFEYLAKYNFDKMADELPAVPETGVNVNAFILFAITAVLTTAVVLKKKVK